MIMVDKAGLTGSCIAVWNAAVPLTAYIDTMNAKVCWPEQWLLHVKAGLHETV